VSDHPSNPQIVTGEAALVLKAYGCHTTYSDKYAAEFSKVAFRNHGVTMEQILPSKSSMYLGSLLPAVNAGSVSLPNIPTLTKEMRLLQRKVGRNRDVVDHPPGQHDDLVNTVSACLHMHSSQDKEEELAFYFVADA
jgi:hypothetical protein